ncbi:unnamed protein product [Alopecurus aequalis]
MPHQGGHNDHGGQHHNPGPGSQQHNLGPGGQHHNPSPGDQPHNLGPDGQHHDHHPGQPLPRLPVPVPLLVPVLPRPTVEYEYLPTTTVEMPLLEPSRPPSSGTIVGVLTCMFFLILLVVAFVLWF